MKEGRWVGTTRESLFAQHPYEFTPGEIHYEKIPLVQYCKNKNISRKQANTLIRKKWLAMTQFKARIWVHEICPDEITNFLN